MDALRFVGRGLSRDNKVARVVRLQPLKLSQRINWRLSPTVPNSP
jgi:hypothetical protein